jgi:hypothetical protein
MTASAMPNMFSSPLLSAPPTIVVGNTVRAWDCTVAAGAEHGTSASRTIEARIASAAAIPKAFGRGEEKSAHREVLAADLCARTHEAIAGSPRADDRVRVAGGAPTLG